MPVGALAPPRKSSAADFRFVLLRLRSDRKNDRTRLIAMTGYGRESDRAMAKRVGFDEHLVKPVSADDLLRLLGEEEAADTYADTSASR